ncbi:MAG: PQQ-binding-like beta-propeller repeat protein, partial [Planctomycetaceae bacterium]
MLALIAFWWSLIVQPPTASAWWQQRRNFQLQPRNFLAPPINENLRGRRLRGEYDGQQPVYSSSRKFTQDWQNAQVLLKSEKPVEALTLLQGILNADEDSYLLNDQGVPDSRNLSLKGATRELLQNLSGDLRQQYEFQWGAEADRHWQQYLKTGQKESLEILIRRFPVSLSGRKGAERLAALNFDRHQPIAAARIYQDLLKSSPQPGEDRRMLTVRLAASWYLAGDDEQAQDVLIEAGLAKNAGQIVIAGRRVNLPVDAQKIIPWLEEHFGSRTLDEDRAFVTSTPEKDLVPGRSGPENWALRGGLPTRNGSGPLGSPHWEPVWQAPTLFRQSTDASERQNDVNATWKKMRDKQRRDRGLSIPAAQPLVVGETVLYRSLTHLSAVDLATGQLKWESFVIDPAANVLMNQYANLEMQATTARESPFEAYLRYRAWFLATTSTLSSDGNLVYVLDDIGHIRTSSMDRRTQIPPLMPRGFNRLLAFDANSGKLRWEAGDDRGDYELELAGAYFLGPPLPLDGMLYCLMKDGDELILLVLNAQTGEREWELSLLAAPAVPQIRKLSVDGLSPSYSQGVLICPSDTGVLTAVDIVHRELVWSFVDPLLSQTDEAMARMAMQRQHGQEVFMGMPSSLIYGLADRTWLDGLPVIAGGNLLVTLPESHDLYCLSLIDGKLKWNVPRDRGLFIGTASGGQVLVVEEHQLQSYRLSDGAPVWPQPIQLPAAPCGRGLRSGNIYQLPIEKQEILHIDLQSGQILSRAAVPPDVELGNLIGAHGAVVSQASNSVTAFQRLDVTWGRLNETLAKQPDDAEALAIRGEIRLSLGAEEAGLNDLRKSFELSNNN